MEITVKKFKPTQFAKLFSNFRERLWDLGFRRFDSDSAIENQDDLKNLFLTFPVRCIKSEIYADYFIKPNQNGFSSIVWIGGRLDSRGILLQVGVGITLLPLNEILEKLGYQHGIGSLVLGGGDLTFLAGRANDDFQYSWLLPDDDYDDVIDNLIKRIVNHGMPLASQSVSVTLQTIADNDIDTKKVIACLLLSKRFDEAESRLGQLIREREHNIEVSVKHLVPMTRDEVEDYFIKENVIVSREFIKKVKSACDAKDLKALDLESRL